MATIVAAAGGGNWTATTTWTGGVVPTAADDVQLASTSGSVTLDTTGIACRSLNCTGYTATLTHTAGVTLNIGDATAGAGNIALKFVIGMGWSAPSATCVINFISTSTTSQTIDMGGKQAGSLTFNGIGGSWLLSSSMTMISSGSITLTAGTLDSNGLNHTWGSLVSTGSGVRTLTLGASLITMTGGVWDFASGTNLTFNAGTSLIRWNPTSATPNINASGKTFYDMEVIKSSGGLSLNNSTGTMTFRNLTMDNTVLGGGNRALTVTGNLIFTGILKFYGFSDTNSGMLSTNSVGTQRTISLGTTGSVDFSNIDFREIAVTGTNAPVSGYRLGNFGNNSGITFNASRNLYWIGSAGVVSYNSATNWSLTSGGAAANEIPLVHDFAIFDANSFTASGMGVSMNNLRQCGFDASAATNSPIFRWTNPSGGGNSVAGSMIYPTGGCTIDAVGAAGGSTTITMYGRGNHVLNFNGATIGASISYNQNGPGGIYTLQSNMTMTAGTTFGIGWGTFDANGYNLTIGVVNCSSSNTRAILMGSGTWTLTGTGAVWNGTTGTNMTLNPGTSTLVVSDTSATAKNLDRAAGQSFYDVFVSGGTGIVSFRNATTSTMHDLLANPGAFIRFNVVAIYNFTGTRFPRGAAGNPVTIDTNTAGTAATLNKPSGVIFGDYLNLKDTAAGGGATWFAGANSTNVSNNTGWVFTAAFNALNKALAYAVRRTPQQAFVNTYHVDATSVPHDFAANITGAYSFDFMLRQAITGNFGFFIPGTTRLDANIEGNTNKLFIWYTDNLNVGHLVYKSPGSMFDGKRHNVIVDKSSTMITVYLDGISVGTYATTTGTFVSSPPFSIGNGFIALDNIRVWNRNLTAPEISGIAANTGAPRSGLKLEWLFDNSTATTAIDTSGNGNNGVFSTSGIIGAEQAKVMQYEAKRPVAITKSLIYRLKAPANIARLLRYGIDRPAVLSKALRYTTASTNARINFVPNPSFEVDTVSWNEYHNPGLTNTILSIDSTTAYSGTKSLKIVTAASGNSYAGTYFQPNGLTPGRSYTLSVWVKGAAGGENFNVYPSTSGTFDITLTTSWQRYIITFIAPNTAPLLYLRSGTAGATFWIDAVQLETGSNATTYFDGSLPGNIWSGTPFNSISHNIYLAYPLKYVVLSAVNKTKALKYTVKYQLTAITKALRYAATRKTVLTASLAYNVRVTRVLTKSLRYVLKPSIALLKSLKYTLKTSPALTKPLSYGVVKRPFLTKTLRYVMKPSTVVALYMVYRLKGKTLKQLNMTYETGRSFNYEASVPHRQAFTPGTIDNSGSWTKV